MKKTPNGAENRSGMDAKRLRMLEQVGEDTPSLDAGLK